MYFLFFSNASRESIINTIKGSNKKQCHCTTFLFRSLLTRNLITSLGETLHCKNKHRIANIQRVYESITYDKPFLSPVKVHIKERFQQFLRSKLLLNLAHLRLQILSKIIFKYMKLLEEACLEGFCRLMH